MLRALQNTSKTDKIYTSLFCQEAAQGKNTIKKQEKKSNHLSLSIRNLTNIMLLLHDQQCQNIHTVTIYFMNNTELYLRVFLHFYAKSAVFQHCMQTHHKALASSVQVQKTPHRVPVDMNSLHGNDLQMS